MDPSTVGCVDVWLIDTRAPAEMVARCVAALDAGEHRRAEAIRCPAARRRFVVAHGAARLILADRLAVAPQELRWRRGEHGKPSLAVPRGAAQCNLSHSGELAMFAVTGRRPVGVDLQEPVETAVALRLAGRFFPAAEAAVVRGADDPAAAFGRLWARKEACAKAAGGRLLPYLARPVGGGPVPCLVRDLPVASGWHAAVALAGATPYAVARHAWPPGHASASERPVLARNTSSRVGR